jgi:hypothetical protein
MSDVLIFGIGLLVFFTTVYGVVMAGGIRLTRRYRRENPELIEHVIDERFDTGDHVAGHRDVPSAQPAASTWLR